MSVMIENNDKYSKDWKTEFSNFGPGDMSFSYGGKTLLESNGVELGILKEVQGIEKFCRSHYSDKTDWTWVDSYTSHPFGSEPVIKRKWEQAANHIRVVTDIIIRAATPMEHLDIDSLKLPGNWNKVLIYSQVSADSSEVEVKEVDLSNFSGKTISFDFIPLVLLFTSDDGIELEIGTGYDLWRWHEIVSRFNGKSEFNIKVSKDGLEFNRKILFLDEKYEMPRNNFRFSWYFAWGNASGAKLSDIDIKSCNLLTPLGKKLITSKNNQSECPSKDQSETTDNSIDCYALDNNSWPITALVTDGTNNTYPCFCSRQTGNYLKTWFRSLRNTELKGNKDICLSDIDVHICSNASHLVRGKKVSLVHWDYSYLLVFWEWANKTLGDTDNSFYILFDKNSIFSCLPSVRGLADKSINLSQTSLAEPS